VNVEAYADLLRAGVTEHINDEADLFYLMGPATDLYDSPWWWTVEEENSFVPRGEVRLANDKKPRRCVSVHGTIGTYSELEGEVYNL
jgi:hypothetical protein